MENPVPFFQPSLDEAEIDEVVDTLRSGWLTTGPKVRRMEEIFREYVGTRHAIALSSGTAALHLALAGLGVGPGDEVILPTLTFCSCAHVVVHLGARPVLADISSDDYNLDPDDLEDRVTSKTKAIMAVHYAGQPCRMDAILNIAESRGLPVIEDAAHAVGARYQGRAIGGIGRAAAFSFYATKNITTGEGGMLTTDDDELAERARLLSLHGMSHDAWRRYTDKGSWYYEVLAPGYKYNMTDIQASLGIHQMAKLESFTQDRATLAELYNRCLADTPAVALPKARPEVRHAWHLYPIQLETERLTIDRSRFIDLLRERGIGASVHFIPIHHHPWYQREFHYQPRDYPVAESVYWGLISLPLYPGLGEHGVSRVAEAVHEIIKAHLR